MSARKRKLVFKRYSLGRSKYWRFILRHSKDMESAFLFGLDFASGSDKTVAVRHFRGLTTYTELPNNPP